LALDVVDVGQDVLERPEALDELARGLVADTGDAGMLSELSPFRP